MTGYRVKGWDEHFENNRSRERKKLDWVPVPNKHDGEGYNILISHEDGPAHFAAWIAIIQVASKCQPRGTLVRDSGTPHDAKSLSVKTRLPVEIFVSALQRLTCAEIGWLEVFDVAPSCENVAPECLEEKGKKEENGREENGRFASSIEKLKEGHKDFKKIRDIDIINSLRNFPEDRWTEAIDTLLRKCAGASIRYPCGTLENFLNGKTAKTSQHRAVRDDR